MLFGMTFGMTFVEIIFPKCINYTEVMESDVIGRGLGPKKFWNGEENEKTFELFGRLFIWQLYRSYCNFIGL